ncbi:Versiconal hemiacetal acetate esterase [Colletotrichum siamense]|uniref:Versiconal hemiacetal acetate esterase n=1 Tax=Colletotrichum siamense TaxID=690259 RepID=UPI0018724B62|nr:Versiconal hemiacetal acetate esterase [Colletotrichum siamense]KAF5506338.1 Versiconal hemiacetal acetate esterase [Colletotrichum siamense]
MGDLESSQSQYQHLGVPDPEWTAFYEKNAARVPHLVGSPQHLRDVMAELKVYATAMAPQFTGLTTKDIQVKVSDGFDIPCRIYTPVGAQNPAPGLLYIHGGGWTLGDLEGEDIACKAICEYTKVVVVSMDYRLAPENPFPRGLEDCWDILLWTLENSSTLGIDPNCVMVSGSSSGGNSTAVIAHRARDKGVALKGQILRIPATCHIDCYPPELKLRSMEELKDAPLLSKRSMETFYGYYSPPDPSSPEVSPLLNQNFKDLAPAYLQVAGMDPLRDEGLAYAAKLKDAGVPTKVDIYPGLPHAFGYFPELSATPKFSIDVITAIVQLIGGNL